jgi:hypothetical protein
MKAIKAKGFPRKIKIMTNYHKSKLKLSNSKYKTWKPKSITQNIFLKMQIKYYSNNI